MPQLRKMERECRWRDFETIADLSCGHSLDTRPHQKSKDFEPILLGQCGQGWNDVIHFHHQRIVELGEHAVKLTLLPFVETERSSEA